MEETLHEIIEEESNELRLQLENKEKELEDTKTNAQKEQLLSAEKNPITKLSNNYNNKLLNKIKENFNKEQQKFIRKKFIFDKDYINFAPQVRGAKNESNNFFDETYFSIL